MVLGSGALSKPLADYLVSFESLDTADARAIIEARLDALEASQSVTYHGSTSVAVYGTGEIAVHPTWQGQASLSVLGTVTTGTWQATPVGLAYGGTGQDYSTRVANTVWAGPTTGADAAPAFRVLVAADIPDLSGVYQPLDTQLTSLAGLSYTGNSLKVVRVNVGETGFELASVSAGSGDVVGPASAVDNRVVFFDGVTGKLIKDSGLTLSGSNTGDQTITLTGDVTGTGTGSFATTLAADAVTYAKLQNASAGNVVLTRAASTSGDYGETALGASQLLGRGSTGDVAAIALGTGLSMSGATLSGVTGGNLDLTDLPHMVQMALNRGAWLWQWNVWQAATADNLGFPAVHTTIGTLAANTAGSPTHSPFDLTKAFRRQPRRRLVASASTAGTSTGLYNTDVYMCGTGGWIALMRIGNCDAATVANARCFYGVRTATGVPANSDPSNLVNCVGFGADTGDTNMQVMHNDGSGTCTKVDCGAGFPANTSDTDFYEMTIGTMPGGTTIQCCIRNLASGATFETGVTTNMPSASTGLGLLRWRNNGTTALTVEFHMGATGLCISLDGM